MAERRFSGKFDNICDFVIDWQGLDQRNSARANEIRTVPISLYRLHQNRKRDCSENGNKNSDHRVITFSKGVILEMDQMEFKKYSNQVINNPYKKDFLFTLCLPIEQMSIK